MIIIGESLKALMAQYKVIDNDGAYDAFSLTLTLHNEIANYTKKSDGVLVYGEELEESDVCRSKINHEGLLMNPKDCVLGCSHEYIHIPKGYLGFIQTKGSLARLFISIHCSDGQIEPGFSGRVTFEICNHGNHQVKIMPNAKVAQLFLFKTSSREPTYNGKYNNYNTPTVYKY